MKIKDLTNKKELTKLYELYEEELYQNTEINTELTRKTIKEEEKFFETLTNEQKNEFNRLCELKTLNGAETDKNIFVYTFCLAARLIFESID